MNVRITATPDGTMTPVVWLASVLSLARDLLDATIASKQIVGGSLIVVLAFPTETARTRFLNAARQCVEHPLDGGLLKVEVI